MISLSLSLSLFHQLCEYCRLYSGCFVADMDLCPQTQYCGPGYMPKLSPDRFAELYPDFLQSGLRADHLLNYFGQVLYSQFIGALCTQCSEIYYLHNFIVYVHVHVHVHAVK